MPEKTRRSPQEKKALSYARDRRNAYGENDKASRKAIPARKAKAHRKERRAAASALQGAQEAAVLEARLDAFLGSRSRKDVWRKKPDRPLGEHVTLKQTLRR